MDKEIDLNKRILELRLEKRELVLAGKNTYKIDQIMKVIEEQLKEKQMQ